MNRKYCKIHASQRLLLASVDRNDVPFLELVLSHILCSTVGFSLKSIAISLITASLQWHDSKFGVVAQWYHPEPWTFLLAFTILDALWLLPHSYKMAAAAPDITSSYTPTFRARERKGPKSSPCFALAFSCCRVGVSRKSGLVLVLMARVYLILAAWVWKGMKGPWPNTVRGKVWGWKVCWKWSLGNHIQILII